jgi:hypothetical protein
MNDELIGVFVESRSCLDTADESSMTKSERYETLLAFIHLK